MKICLVGKNLTNYVLANVLAKKKLPIDIVYNFELKKNDSSRTLAISNNNYKYLKKISKKLNFSSWPTKKIKIYVEGKNSKELLKFTNNNQEVFNLIKYNEIFKSFSKNM